MKGWYMRCCDCGSVHRVDFRVVDGKVEMKVKRLPKRGSKQKKESPCLSC